MLIRQMKFVTLQKYNEIGNNYLNNIGNTYLNEMDNNYLNDISRYIKKIASGRLSWSSGALCNHTKICPNHEEIHEYAGDNNGLLIIVNTNEVSALFCMMMQVFWEFNDDKYL